MTKKIIYKVLFILIIISNNISAQDIELKSSNFKEQKEEFKIASDNMKAGDEFLLLGETALLNKKSTETFFQSALEKYLLVYNFNSKSSDLNYKIGKCLLQSPKKLSSIPYLEKAIELNPDVNVETYYLLGQAYQYDYKFKEAQGLYDKYEELLKSKQLNDIIKDFRKKHKECTNAIKFTQNPERVWLVNLKEINSIYPDYCASITTDESYMVFNSKRSGNVGGEKDKEGNYYSDIFYTEKINGKWTSPKAYGNDINTSGHDENVSLSLDGQKMYIYKEVDGNGDIYETKLDGDKWAQAIKLTDKMNTEFTESNASFSPISKKIYFITNNPNGTEGGKDIFFTGMVDEDRDWWGKGITLSHDLNTEYDEGSIFMCADGRTIYFASQGHNSMGGYDIFKSTFNKDGVWTVPENLGYPINTPYDEIYFSISASGKTAYVTSNREQGGVGDYDIYRIKYLGAIKSNIIDNEDQLLSSSTESVTEMTIEESVEVESMSLTILKGKILDDFTGEPIEADIEIINNQLNQKIASFTSNKKTGKYIISLPSGLNYGIAIKEDGYLFHSENFDLPEASDYELIEKDIRLKNIDIGSKIVLKNVFFDTGKSTLRKESNTELMRLVKLMQDIPKLKIEISGFTDNVGSESTNKNLSESRAKAVVTFLTNNGIPANRLTSVGYGSEFPIADNNTEKGRQLNRRTEFKIITN